MIDAPRLSQNTCTERQAIFLTLQQGHMLCVQNTADTEHLELCQSQTTSKAREPIFIYEQNRAQKVINMDYSIEDKLVFQNRSRSYSVDSLDIVPLDLSKRPTERLIPPTSENIESFTTIKINLFFLLKPDR